MYALPVGIGIGSNSPSLGHLLVKIIESSCKVVQGISESSVGHGVWFERYWLRNCGYQLKFTSRKITIDLISKSEQCNT